MRLHELTVRAVGPFADAQTVDFDRLGSGGLFLFEGPTGVGKSTILDAITFALYGGLASDASDPSRMRSDFADPQVAPEVVLEFSVRGTRYRVTRSPEHQRPKLRGTGVTTERARVHLERAGSSGWASVSHSKEEVGTLVSDVIGLSREQFRQVVLLPQGEFATFLRADDDRRREVLMKLFGAQFYRRVADQLQARAQAARLALAEADSDLSARIAAAWEAAGREPDEVVDAGAASMEQRVVQMDDLGAQVEAEAARAASAAERCDVQVGTARAALTTARDVLERVDRRAALLEAVQRHEAGRAAHEARRGRLDRARRAAPVGPLLDLLAEAEAAVAGARADLDALPVVPGLLADGSIDEATPAALLEAAEHARATAARLGHIVERERELPDLRSGLDAAHQRVEALGRERAAVQERARALPEQSRRAQEELDAARAAAGRRAELEQRLRALTDRLTAATRVQELTGEVERARAEQRSARRAYERARDTVVLLTEHRLDDLRGELAGQLVSGDPCLVCGSCEHPAPAVVRGAGVTDQQVRDAVAERDQAHLEREAAEVALARATGQRDAAEAVADGASIVDLGAELAAVAAEQADAERSASAVAQLAGLVEQLGEESALVAARLLDISGQLSGAEASATALGAELARVEQQVLDARDGFPSVSARVQELSIRAASAARRAETLAQLAAAEAQRAQLSARAAAQAQGAGFADVREATAALMEPGAVQSLADEVDSWVAHLEVLRGQAGAAELASVAGLAREPLERAVQEAEHAVRIGEEAAEAARREATVSAQRWERFRQRRDEVRRAHRERVELAARNDEIIALDQYARGMAGSPRMTLVTFVLRYWFEQVVAAANVRLAEMSAGKYQLVRVDEASRRDARVGLGLAVLDRHTGKERSPSTLSGGESFYTSLALALGLADVVVAQAGGAQLDTLFIDEGFGSLDPDTLDDVMAVIDELRGNGRVVGIVSHVPDLKERITERLSIRRVRPDGPSEIRMLA